MASIGGGALRALPARVAATIRIDEVWLAVNPLGMRVGFVTASDRVVRALGAAHPHHAYLRVAAIMNLIRSAPLNDMTRTYT